RVAGPDAGALRRARRDRDPERRRGRRDAGPDPAQPRVQPRVDLRSGVTDANPPGPTADAVVVTADRALAPPLGGLASAHDRARGATSVLAIDGAIVRVGDPDEVAADPRATGARRIAWPGRAMVPGTVNTHNHSFQSLLRGIGDDLPFLEWRDRALYRYSPRLDADGMAPAALFPFGRVLLPGRPPV